MKKIKKLAENLGYNIEKKIGDEGLGYYLRKFGTTNDLYIGSNLTQAIEWLVHKEEYKKIELLEFDE